MTRTYSLVIETGPTGLSAYVPELPSILLTYDLVESSRRHPSGLQLLIRLPRFDRLMLTDVADK